jgi:hypothetical protein
MRITRLAGLAVALGLVALMTGCGDSQSGSETTPTASSQARVAASSPASPGSSGADNSSAWTPNAADKLWPCSLVPTSVMRGLGVNAPSSLQGTSYTPGNVYSCSLVNGHGASVTVNVGSADPSGSTAGYSRIVLNGNLPAWQKVVSATSMGATGDGWAAFIQVLVNGQFDDSAAFYGSVGCSTCTKAQVTAIAQQIAAAVVPAEEVNGGAPPAGTVVVSYP